MNFTACKWQPTPVSLPGKSHGQKSLAGCSPWGRKESGTTGRLRLTQLQKLSMWRVPSSRRPSIISQADCVANEPYNHTEGGEKKQLTYFGKQNVDWIFLDQRQKNCTQIIYFCYGKS